MSNLTMMLDLMCCEHALPVNIFGVKGVTCPTCHTAYKANGYPVALVFKGGVPCLSVTKTV